MNLTMAGLLSKCNNNGRLTRARVSFVGKTSPRSKWATIRDMNRNGRCFLLLILLILLLSDYQVNSDSDTRLLRRKRYVVFPEGSTFSIALCLTFHTLTPDDIFTEGVNWGISYDLPNESKPALEPFLQLRHDQIKPENKYGGYSGNSVQKNVKYSGWNSNEKYYFKPGKKKYYKPDYYYLQRRHRRELYSKLETIMNAMNFDGRSCVLRALCEASQRLMPKGNTLIEEMMRISFSFPLKRLFSNEPEEHHAYSRAHKAGHKGQDCAVMFAGCSFSLIDMALGKYDAPATRQPQLPVGYADTAGFSGDRTRHTSTVTVCTLPSGDGTSSLTIRDEKSLRWTVTPFPPTEPDSFPEKLILDLFGDVTDHGLSQEDE